MAKKSSGGGLLLLLLIAAIAAIPKEAWVVIGVVAALGFVVYLNQKSQSPRSPSPPEVPSVRRLPSQPRVQLTISTGYGRAAGSQPDPHVTSEQCWVPPGRVARIGDLSIPAGMVYVGARLGAIKGFEIEPALIDATLPVRGTGPAQRMPYWPSYSGITAEARGEFLQWLVTGRRDPSVQLGCVFLFLYGLERRLLHDAVAAAEVVTEERGALLAEVEALLTVYGESGSFRGYATALVDVLGATGAQSDLVYNRPPPEPNGHRGLRWTHKVALGQAARDGIPLSAAWAYSWLMHDELTPHRTAAQRCPDEFKRVFQAMYTQRYGSGLLLPVNKTRLRVTYRPANASFPGPVALEVGALPDVTVLKRPIEELRSLSSDANDALAPFSRYIGKNPEKRGTMDAIALLPPVLWPRESLTGLANWLRRLGVAKGPQVAKMQELLQHFPAWSTMNRERAIGLAVALEYLGVGIDPDVRFGAGVPTQDSEVGLFSLPRELRGKAPTAAYAVAALTMQLAASVAAADGVSAEEKVHLEETVERMQHLEPHERLRLHAHLLGLIRSQPRLNTLKSQIDPLTKEQRQAIGGLVITVAHVDGQQTPAELKVLAKIYRLLGLSEETMYRDAHQAATEPVTVAPAGGAQGGYPIPAPPMRRAAAVGALDPQRVAHLKEESAKVSAMLGSIFANSDDSQHSEEPIESARPVTTLAGLDVEHSGFASALLGRPTWTREELEDLAADQGILLDGALERVNEAFLDAYSQPLFEGDGPVTINSAVLKELEPV
jgi:uncharacterized tellurite resistance protein B-like protein